ncbi:PREDICTED: uncharacterized protein LOC104759943 [Camelina sativa]|uniref:Uncharacterized protein LOC104759943 n=1 Tax=Camelina sativa TaxID=90675 RepID=A0ABM0X5N3_CAMSA|nr:PREDICTED: uncharacterized protein LOC104759943 [Camelina sativa]
MSKDLWEALQNLNLGSERSPMRMSREALKDREDANKLSLVVKCLNPQHQKPIGMKGALPKAWNLQGKVTSRINDDDTVQFFFKAEHHLMTVLENGPWHYNLWMVAIDRWTRRLLLTFLTEISFWVRILNIPEEFRSDAVVHEVGGVLGHIDEVRFQEATEETNGEVLARVTMNINDRLICVRYIEFDPSKPPVMIRFVFPKLRKFCFRCGSLRHDQSSCDYAIQIPQIDDEDTFPARPREEDDMSITPEYIPLTIREYGATSKFPTGEIVKSVAIGPNDETSATLIKEASLITQPVPPADNHQTLQTQIIRDITNHTNQVVTKDDVDPALTTDRGQKRKVQDMLMEDQASTSKPRTKGAFQGRGLKRNPLTIPYLKDIRKSTKPDILFLVETKNGFQYVNNLGRELAYPNSFILPSEGSSGGMAIFWNDAVKVDFVDTPSLNYTDLYISEPGSPTFLITYVYGDPDYKHHNRMWDTMTFWAEAGLYRGKPRLVLGDFNDILSNEEKFGGPQKSENSFKFFRKMLNTSGLHDLKVMGGKFTWTGQRYSYSIMSRIDRAVASADWQDMFPKAYVQLLDWIGYDHRPILIYTGEKRRTGCPLFRYDNRWRFNKEIKEELARTWNSECHHLSPKSFYEALKKCRSCLSKWKTQNPINSARRIQELKAQIHQAYNTSPVNLNHIKVLKTELTNVYRMEEEYWKTKSRIQWLQAGDRNTRFFHAKTKQRRSYNRISAITDTHGKVWSDEKGISRVIIDYFHNLYRTDENQEYIDDVVQYIKPRVSEEMNKELTEPITEEELYRAVRSMSREKAPGPDGFNPGFYHGHWSTIHTGVYKFAKLLFEEGELDPRMNNTHICLIPKVSQPSEVRDYRPISLANVAYKIISKALAERLKPWLNDIISTNQSAFIPGRMITDNILIAHELIHSLHTKKLVKPFIATKLDISKAFDKVEWSFIEAVMRRMGFSDLWCKWIMKCITTVSYSVFINGQPVGQIKPQRVIRQGDPISPCVYLLCTEALSALIQHNIKEKKFDGFKASRNGPPISHLLFADDSLMFCRASVDECTTILNILQHYEKASGQSVNFQKSAITFGKGKEVLLKSVITAIPTYSMSCFLLPQRIITQITKAMCHFWWSNTKDKHKVPWIAWNKITNSKEIGGLAIRDLKDFNLALLAKQSWRILHQPTSLLARVLKAKYYSKQSLLTSTCKSNSSYAWKSISQGTHLLSQGIKYIVGTGNQINVWHDKWLPLNPPRPARGHGATLHPTLKVSDLISQGRWNENMLHSYIHHEDIPHIRRIRPSITGADDEIAWIHTKSGLYSVKSGYHLQRKLSTESSSDTSSSFNISSCTTFKKLWAYNMPQKLKHLWWRCLHNALPVANNLKKKKMLTDDTCQRCGEAPEDLNHLLFHCRISKEIWSLSANNHHPGSFFSSNSLTQNVDMMLNLSKNQRKDVSLFPFIGWRIWKMRNDLIFNNKKWSIPDTINKAIIDSQQWKESLEAAHDDVQTKQTQEQKQSQSLSTPTSTQSIISEAKDYCCFVDGSWRSPNDCAGIAWVLYHKNAQILLQGKASIPPMNTPLEVEAEALKLAVHHLSRLGYNNVMFCGDAQILYKNVAHIPQCKHKQLNRDQFLITTQLRDIENMVSSYETITFVKIPRSVNYVADSLAKDARISKSDFVISWNTVT